MLLQQQGASRLGIESEVLLLSRLAAEEYVWKEGRRNPEYVGIKWGAGIATDNDGGSP
jgi:hypothetical protein